MKVNRWGIAVAGIVLQIVLGSVYAWSVFRTPLTKQFHWSISEVTLTFTISIVVLGFSAFFGGLWLTKAGPRTVAVTGALLYGLGTLLASFSANNLWVLYLTYGFLGGVGLGLAYIVPVSVLVKWFPDRRGFITGVAVGGFGAGALITAPVATRLMASVGVLHTFAVLGAVYIVAGVAAAVFMRNPDAGWTPDGWVPSAALAAQRSARNFTLGEALRTWQWWALWTILFLNTSAGISLISQESPVFQELAKVTVAAAAGMVGIVSIGNAVGRVFWAWVSDLLSRKTTFIITFLLQVALFWFLPGLTSAAIVTVVAFVILMCYGGGFGTMPAFTADYFGSANVGPIYGLMFDGVGCGECIWPATGGAYASGEWELSEWVSYLGGNYFGGYFNSAGSQAAQECRIGPDGE